MTTRDIILSRKRKAEVLGRAHALAADRFEGHHRWLGVPAVILSTIVGTTYFASLTNLGKMESWIAVGAGVLSVTAAVLTGLQTFHNYAVKSQKHADAAARFFAFARQCELAAMDCRNNSDEGAERLDRQFATIIQESPRVSIKRQNQAMRSLDMERQGTEHAEIVQIWPPMSDDLVSRGLIKPEYKEPA